MRSSHGGLLLAVAVVMALLSTGICMALAPAPAHEQTCLMFFENSCSNSKSKTCHEKCLSQVKGHGSCMHSVCWCRYPCKPFTKPPPLDA